MTSPSSPQNSVQPSAAGSARLRAGQMFSFVPLALALVVTLVLGGASVARALSVPPLDALTDLEFSLGGEDWTNDGEDWNWTNEPDLVLGQWGCDSAGGSVSSDPDGAIGGTVGVDPCSMSPGEYVDRTYFVRNSTNTGRTGLYEVGIGEFELSPLAEFNVRSEITEIKGATGRSEGDYSLYGPGTAQADLTPAPGTRLAALELAPGAVAKVVDTVSIPVDPENYEQDQSVSPRMWVSFSDIGVVDSDGDGLPNNVEGEIGTDPEDPYNPLPDGTVGQRYGPWDFLPVTPEGATVVVETSTLPPGMTLEDGVLAGRPSVAGTYDIAFTITMPGGAEFTSIRRVVIRSSGGGSSDLPDFFWPVLVGGVIGVIIGILAPDLGSSAGSVGGPAGGSAGGSAGSAQPGGPGGSSPVGSVPDPGGSIPVGSVPGAGHDDDTTGTPADDNAAGTESAVDGTTGQIAVETVTPREGSPSDDWVRANSEVRSSLPTTGVGATDLVLWALTAAAAGVTLILFAKRRRARGVED